MINVCRVLSDIITTAVSILNQDFSNFYTGYLQMDIKLALINLFDILLRVPSLFLLDEIFHSSLADLGLYPSSLLPLHKEADFDFVTGESNHTLVKPYSSKENYDPAVFGNLTLGLTNVIQYGILTPIFSYLDWIFINDGGVIGIIIQLFLLFTGKFEFIFKCSKKTF